MACWFNYPDDASAHANIICSSTGSLIFCKFPLLDNLVQKLAYLVSSFQSHVHCFIGHAIVLGRVDCRSVSFVSSKFFHFLLLLNSLLELS